MPVFNNALAGAAGSGGADAYKIERSLRFNRTDSASLSRTITTIGNRKKHTFSFWVKRSRFSEWHTIFSAGNSSPAQRGGIRFQNTDKLEVTEDSGAFHLETSRVFRDPSAWYHIVVVYDSTQATASNRIKIYVNGVQETDFDTANYPNQNHDGIINHTDPHRIGELSFAGNVYEFGGYLAEVIFLDGIAISDPDGVFGEFDADTGVWNPIEYTGSFSGPAVGSGVVYSAGVSSPQGLQSSNPATNAFDGSTSTAATTNTVNGSPTLTVTFDPPLTGVTSLRMHTGNIGSNQYATGYGLVNGTSISHSTLGASYGSGWVDFTGHFSGTTVSSMGLGQTNAGSYALGLSIDAIEVNGTILQDGIPAGVNGFYLDFDPAAASQIYSTGGDDTNAANSGVGWATLFDTSYEGAYPLQNTTMNWTGSIPANGKNVRIGYRADSYAGGTIVVNNTSTTLNSGNFYNVQWVDLGTFSADITSMSVTRANVGHLGGIIWSYLEVDGKIVVNYEPPGVDASGNENHWKPRNLAAGGTFAATISASASPSGSTGFHSSYPGSRALDSSDSTQASANYSAGDTTIVTVNFNPALIAGSTLTAKIYQYQTYHSIKVNSGSYVTASGSVVNLLSGHGVSAGDSITSISYKTVSPNSSFALGNELYYIKNGGTNVLANNVLDTDIFIDSPSNYQASTGNNGGNYATLNPLDSGSNITFSNGNLQFESETSSGTRTALSSIGMSSGKWYFEGQSLQQSNVTAFGIATKDVNRESYLGQNTSGWSWLGEGSLYHNGNAQSNFGGVGGFAVGDIVGIAFDADNGTLKYYKNGTLVGTAYSGLSSDTYFFAASDTGSTTCEGVVNFGQHPFIHTPPTGYKSLCTQNLDDPLIKNPSTAFQTKLWDGTQAARSITTTGMGPDLVWIKGRSHATWHELFDSVRGPEKRVFVNEPDAEATNANTLTAFNSDGFSLLGDAGVNGTSNRTYVGWAWDGGDLVTNSTYNQSQTWSNSLTSSNGFWTGQGATNAFDGTGSSVTGTNNGGTLTFSPNLTIPANSTIQVRPSSHSSGYTVVVNGVSNSITGDSFHTVNYDGSTTLSSITVTSAGSTSGDLKGIKINGKLLVDKGVIPVGSLTSSVYDQTQTWSTYGTFENHYTGSGGAYLWDDVFNTSDVNNGDGSLYVNTTSLDKWTLTSSQAVSSTVKILVQGANAKLTINAGLSDETTVTSTQTNYHYLTASFSGNVSSVSVGPANSGQAIYVMGIWFDDVRLVDDTETVPNVPSIASTTCANPATGVSIVSYTGTGANATIAHGLNAAPEFAIFKARNGSNHWLVYHKSLGNDKKLNLNLSDGQSSSSTSYFQSTDPTSKVFYLGTESSGNWSNYNMIGYLFSSVEGYSAFGTYEGNNNANGPFLYTGFKPAFFLVKNIDASQPWNIYDAARDPYNAITKGLQPPSPGLEYSTTDRCDFLSNGIKIKSSGGTVPNLSANTYVYAAFAENPFKTARAR